MPTDFTKPDALQQTWGALWDAEDLAALDVNDSCADAWTRIHKPAVDRWLIGLPSGAILEMGCGLGQWTRYYAKSREAVGIDIVSEAVQRAQARADQLHLPNASFVQGDARVLPFPDATFAGVSSFGVIEHFRDQDVEKLLAESFRVLKPGGQLLVTTPNVWCMHSVTRPLLQIMGKWNLGLERSFTHGTLARYAEKAGFAVRSQGVLESGSIFGDFITKRAPFFDGLSRSIERRQSTFGFVSFAIAERP